MRKILFVITGLHVGGAEMMLWKLCDRIDRTKFQPVVLSLMGDGPIGERLRKSGVEVHTINMSPGRPTPGALARLVRKVREIQPHLLQGWMYHGNLAAQLAGVFLKGKVPVLWNIRHCVYSLKYEKRSTALLIAGSRWFSKKPRAIIYNTRTGAGQHEGLGYSSKHTHVLPNGFDLDLFAPSPDAYQTVRAELGVPEDAFLIGLIGRYDPMKDHRTFLEAAHHFVQANPHVHFVCAGRGVTMENPDFAGWVQEFGLQDHVHLLGERNDTPRLMSAFDILTSSSYSEGFSNVIGEAMACGTPCVVTDVGDSAWIVGKHGLVVPPRDPASLAVAWQSVLNMNPAKLQEMGRLSRQRVQDNFSLEFIVNRYENLYGDVLKGAL
ncbi:glycosyltransferase [Tumebacillus sp. ITR2]|uniref:Glycosyltransferase n=1 Tax=Tumebacillus amylolyticus TaxID=2801339 RepID=A0ABS1JG30_9BACL|nr:glycosyltransferase [Tumebacillus amylolyticus]MBL0389245.1 glycosyltransferase [Tumebacillus amylolyticus]